jgi:hypothetical protein
MKFKHLVFSFLIPIVFASLSSCDLMREYLGRERDDEVEVDGYQSIGSEGGVIEITDSSSPLYGVRLEIPPGALPEKTAIAIRSYEENTAASDGMKIVSPIIRLEPDGLWFASPVRLTMPYDGELVTDPQKVFLFTRESTNSHWNMTTSLNVNTDQHTITSFCRHFSDFSCQELVIQITSLGTIPDFLPQIDGLPTVNNESNTCAGNVSFTKWYFEKRPVPFGLSILYEQDQAIQVAIAAHAQTTDIDDLNIALSDAENDERNIDALLCGLMTERQPQILYMWGTNLGEEIGHAVLVYKYDQGKFWLFDPNDTGNPTLGIQTAGNDLQDYIYHTAAFNKFFRISDDILCNPRSMDYIYSTFPKLLPSGTPILACEDNDLPLSHIVKWTPPNSTGIRSYRLYRAKSPGVSVNSVLAAMITDSSLTEHIEQGLNPNTDYYYKVYVDMANGLYLPSDEVKYRTPIRAPSWIEASDGRTDEVYITWDPVPEALDYEVYRSLNPEGPYTSIGWTDPATATYFSDTPPVAGVPFYYKVAGTYPWDRFGDSSTYTSGYRGTAPLSAPTGVEATDGEYADRITVSWNQVQNAEKYYIYRATSSGGSYSERGSTSSLIWNDTSASQGVTYYYKVKAWSSSVGYSTYSSYDFGYLKTDSISAELNVDMSPETIATGIDFIWTIDISELNSVGVNFTYFYLDIIDEVYEASGSEAEAFFVELFGSSRIEGGDALSFVNDDIYLMHPGTITFICSGIDDNGNSVSATDEMTVTGEYLDIPSITSSSGSVANVSQLFDYIYYADCSVTVQVSNNSSYVGVEVQIYGTMLTLTHTGNGVYTGSASNITVYRDMINGQYEGYVYVYFRDDILDVGYVDIF